MPRGTEVTFECFGRPETAVPMLCVNGVQWTAKVRHNFSGFRQQRTCRGQLVSAQPRAFCVLIAPAAPTPCPNPRSSTNRCPCAQQVSRDWVRGENGMLPVSFVIHACVSF